MNHSRNSVRKLTMLALLTAMSIVFARVLSISTGFVRFNLGSLPTLLAAVLFGPVEGFAVGAVADMIGGTLRHQSADHAGGRLHRPDGGPSLARPAQPAAGPAHPDQRVCRPCGGLHCHQLAGTPPLL